MERKRREVHVYTADRDLKPEALTPKPVLFPLYHTAAPGSVQERSGALQRRILHPEREWPGDVQGPGSSTLRIVMEQGWGEVGMSR